MVLNYKYRLYVNKHTEELSQLVTTSIHVWNHVVALYRRYYKLFGKNPSCAKMQHHIAAIAKRDQRWSLMGSQSLQELCQRVDATYKEFFKKKGRGRPNFHKTCGNGSFMFKGRVGYGLDGNELTINKLGHAYRLKLTREYGAVKNVHIKRDNMGYLWLIVTTDVKPENRERLGNASIGLDFGLKHLFTTNDGEVIDSPESYKHALRQLRKLSRDVSHKVKGSNSKKKAVKRLAKLHEKVANQRCDFHWKLAHELCKHNVLIAIEDLNIKAMQKMWGRKVNDLGGGEFVGKLEYVASKYGTTVVKIDRFAASSQICHCCGYKNAEVKNLGIRKWECPQCGATHNRDVNAAINILNMACGKGVSHDRSNGKTSRKSEAVA
jgi:putative transposase